MRAGVEALAECCDAAMGMGLDRPDADTEFLGDFEFGKVGEVSQRHDIALATTQRRQQTLQIDAVSDGGLEPGGWLVELLVSSASAHDAERSVDSDSTDPRTGVTLNLPPAQVRLDHGVLRNLLGFVTRAEDPERGLIGECCQLVELVVKNHSHTQRASTRTS